MIGQWFYNNYWPISFLRMNNITYAYLVRLATDIQQRWNGAFPSAPKILFWIQPQTKQDGHYLHLGYDRRGRYRTLTIRCDTWLKDDFTFQIRPGCSMCPMDLPTGYDKDASLKRSISRTEISNGVCAWIAAKYAKGEMV